MINFINLVFTLFLGIIKNNMINQDIYKYQEMKEIRYLYFYNLENFDINNIDIYIADKKLEFSSSYLNYYKVDLNNYYPLNCLKIKINFDNPKFSLKINKYDDFFGNPFAYINVSNFKQIDIDNLIIDSPEWYEPIITKTKPKISKTIRIID